MNLKDLYKPIGRLYEEVPSADYAGDYLAANGGWNNAIEDDPAVASAKSALSKNIDDIKSAESEYNSLYSKWATGCTFKSYLSSDCRGLKKVTLGKIFTFSPISWIGSGMKGCYKCAGGSIGYDDKKTMDKYLITLSSYIADLKSKTSGLEAAVKKAIDNKMAATQASQETVSANIGLSGIKTVEESKQKQIEAELRAKKIFFAITASALLLGVAGFAILRK
jgi:hypothetical protein